MSHGVLAAGVIVELLFTFLKLVVDVITALLPDWTPFDLEPLIATIVAKGDALFGILAWLDWYSPVREAITVFGLGLTMWVSVHIWRAALWILRAVHIVGSK